MKTYSYIIYKLRIIGWAWQWNKTISNFMSNTIYMIILYYTRFLNNPMYILCVKANHRFDGKNIS